MANELNIALPTSGLTVTAQPYQSGSAVGSAISLTEVGSTGFYSGTMTGSAGTYQLAFRSAGANVGSGSIVWSGSAEIPASTFNPTSDTVANVTLCATTTTLTNAPSVPSASAIASQVRTELGTELGRIDATISSRLAPSGTLATVTTLTNAPTVPSASAIASQVRTELATELARVDQNISSRLAAADYNAPTSSPTAASVANAVWSAATKEITGGTVTTLTNAPTVPSASAIASQVRTELATELARVDQNISSRLASSAYTAPANSDITAIKSKTDNLPASPAATSDIPTANITAIKAKTDALPASPAATGDIPSANIAAIKAKTDLLNTDRLAQVSTVSTTGAQLAAALS